MTAAAWPQGYAQPDRTPLAQVLKVFDNLTNVTFANSGTAAVTTVDGDSPFDAPRLRVDAPVGNTYVEVQLHTGVSVPAVPDGQTAYFRLWLSDWEQVTQVVVFAGNSGYVRFLQNAWTVQNNNLNQRGKLLTIPLNSHDTTLNTFTWGSDAFENLKIRVHTRAGFAARFWVDSFGIAAYSRPKVLITFDDASNTWITRAQEELDSRGMKATFGVGTEQVNTNGSLYVTDTELRSLQEAGHQVCAHNVTNTAYSPATLNSYVSEYRTAKAQLQAWGITGPFDYHSFVQGLHDELILNALAEEGVRVFRGVDVRVSSACRLTYPSCGGPYDYKVLKVGSHGPALSLANANANLTALLKYGGTYTAMFHDISAGAPVGVEWQLSDFRSWLDTLARYRDAGLVDVMKATDWYRGLTQPALVS